MTTATMTPGAHASSSEKAISSRTILLSPIDAWFFRDGRPYNSGESNQTDVISLFPPPATTVVGALRAGLARAKGWNGTSNWSTQREIADVLGDGFENLGRLHFHGPWLVRDGEFLFPMPLHVLGRPTPSAKSNEPLWQPACLLTPDKNLTSCDLGDVCLPVTSGVRSQTFNPDGLKEPANQWVTQAGMDLILAGKLPMPEQVVDARDLWRHEARVGLERCELTRTTKEGALYSPRFVRLKRGVSLAMSVDGLPDDWQIPDLLPFGGENRLGDCRSSLEVALAEVLRHAGSELAIESRRPSRIAVTLLTPLLPGDAEAEKRTVAMVQPGEPFFNCEGTTVISACVGKPLTLGGWNSLDRKPLDLRPVLPAGSVWFIEVSEAKITHFIMQAQHGFGLKTRYGFGQVALGVWP